MSKPKGHRAAEGKTFFAKSSVCDGEQKDKCSSLSFYWQRYGFSHFHVPCRGWKEKLSTCIGKTICPVPAKRFRRSEGHLITQRSNLKVQKKKGKSWNKQKSRNSEKKACGCTRWQYAGEWDTRSIILESCWQGKLENLRKLFFRRKIGGGRL